MSIPKVFIYESGYIDLVEHILSKGIDTPDRTSIGQCRKVFNVTLWFDLRKSQPIPTVRNIPPRWAFEEFWFFMSGSTDTKVLEDKGITFWRGNTSREFLDGRGLHNLPEGSMGEAYGSQWRNFNGEGVDQLASTIKTLKEDPYSRRIITTFWNPAKSDRMALLPCFYEHKFNVEKSNEGVDTLHLTVKSRSCDVAFGLPFNYTQYGLYLAAMAKLVDMDAGTLCINIDDAHIYENQVNWCRELLNRGISREEVKLNINKDLNTLDDLVSLKWGDLEIEGLEVNREPFENKHPDMAI